MEIECYNINVVIHIISLICLLKKGVCRWRFFNFWTWFVWAMCSSVDYSLVVIFSYLCTPSLAYPIEVFLNGLHLGCHLSLLLPESNLSKWGVLRWITSWLSSLLSVTWIWFIQVRCFWMDYILAVIFSYCYQSLVYLNEVFLDGLHLGCHLSLLLPKSGLSKWGVFEWITSWLSSFLTVTKVWFIQMRCSWMDFTVTKVWFIQMRCSWMDFTVTKVWFIQIRCSWMDFTVTKVWFIQIRCSWMDFTVTKVWFIQIRCSWMDFTVTKVWFIQLRCSWMDFTVTKVWFIQLRCSWMDFTVTKVSFIKMTCSWMDFTVTKVWFIQMRCSCMDDILAIIFSYCYQSLVYPNELLRD